MSKELVDKLVGDIDQTLREELARDVFKVWMKSRMPYPTVEHYINKVREWYKEVVVDTRPIQTP